MEHSTLTRSDSKVVIVVVIIMVVVVIVYDVCVIAAMDFVVLEGEQGLSFPSV